MESLFSIPCGTTAEQESVLSLGGALCSIAEACWVRRFANLFLLLALSVCV